MKIIDQDKDRSIKVVVFQSAHPEIFVAHADTNFLKDMSTQAVPREEVELLYLQTTYSYDLRKKAVDAYCRGEKKVAICRLMKISRNTLDLWLKGEQATGDFKAIAKRPPKNNRKIQDLERFQKFVRQHQDQTQQQIADKWGENLTQQNVSDGIKKLGITRKKRSDPALCEMTL